MKRGIIIAAIALAIGIAAFLAFASARPGTDRPVPQKTYGSVLQTGRSDLDRDGVIETVIITCKTRSDGRPLGGSVIVLHGSRILARKSGLNPWKLQITDVDADGKREIALGVWKRSPKDPVMAKRVFIYDWTNGHLAPKWLGSRLSRRFVDFEFRDINADGLDELLALEIAPGKPDRIGIYRWKSFGFEWLRSEGPDKWKELTK